jgi:anti-sigma regulatory factor (Ser/Thr protein kinase)
MSSWHRAHGGRGWEFELASEPDSVAKAREHVRASLCNTADADTLEAVELVVSELVTNAVLHGPGEPIKLRLAVDSSGGVAGEIEDQGHGVIEIRKQDVGTAVGPLGLRVVDELTSAWGVTPGSTRVWFRVE